MTVIFDIDGTLADNTERVRKINDDKNEHRPWGDREWELFYDGLEDDKPIKPICEIAGMMIELGRNVVFMTGRAERGELRTIRWLRANVYIKPQVWYQARIFMRPNGDNSNNATVKRHLMARLLNLGHVPSIAFDDDDGALAMYREYGIMAMKVEHGSAKLYARPNGPSTAEAVALAGPGS